MYIPRSDPQENGLNLGGIKQPRMGKRKVKDLNLVLVDRMYHLFYDDALRY